MAKSDKPNTRSKPISSPDELVKTDIKEGKIELTDDELKKVSGGALFMKNGDKKGDTDMPNNTPTQWWTWGT
jgi:bacteriocin-like protein